MYAASVVHHSNMGRKFVQFSWFSEDKSLVHRDNNFAHLSTNSVESRLR